MRLLKPVDDDVQAATVHQGQPTAPGIPNAACSETSLSSIQLGGIDDSVVVATGIVCETGGPRKRHRTLTFTDGFLTGVSAAAQD